MNTYYTLARHSPRGDGSHQHLFEVALCFESVDAPVGFAECDGRNESGGHYTAASALQPEWASHFVDADGEWLIPYIRAMAAGEPVCESEVLRLYRAKHSRQPDSYTIRTL